MNVAVDNDGSLWGVNSANQIFYKKDSVTDWQLIDGGLVQISVSNGIVWGVNSQNQIFRRQGVNGSWQLVDGGLVQISVDSDETVWGVNQDGNIYTRKGFSGSWTQIAGGLSQVDVCNGQVVGVNPAGNIFIRVNNNWVQLEGSLKWVSVAQNGKILGVNSNDQIFYKLNYNSPWQQISGGLKQVQIRKGLAVGVNSADNIWKDSQTCKWD